MQDDQFPVLPPTYDRIRSATAALSFSMASDLFTGSLLKTLVAAKSPGRFLELGTGSGLATSWIREGMDAGSVLLTIDNNELLMNVARENLADTRIEFICTDGYRWLQQYRGESFDLIFADAMPGKYELLEETLQMLKPGGVYLLDDMLPQPNWPEGHAAKADHFIAELEKRTDLTLTKLNWSTGIIIAVKKESNS